MAKIAGEIEIEGRYLVIIVFLIVVAASSVPFSLTAADILKAVNQPVVEAAAERVEGTGLGDPK